MHRNLKTFQNYNILVPKHDKPVRVDLCIARKVGFIAIGRSIQFAEMGDQDAEMAEEQDLLLLFENAIFVACAQEDLLPRSCKKTLRLASRRLRVLVDTLPVDASVRSENLPDFMICTLTKNVVHLKVTGLVRPSELDLVLKSPLLLSLKRLELDVVEFDNQSTLCSATPPQFTSLFINMFLDGAMGGGVSPKWLEGLLALKELHVLHAEELAELSDGISKLTSLKSLRIEEAPLLPKLPESLGHLFQLTSINLGECAALTALPATLCNLPALKRLAITAIIMKELPQELSRITTVTALNLKGCRSLSVLPDLSPLSHLHTLSLHGCRSLIALPDWLGGMTSLREVAIGGSDRDNFFPPFLCQLTALVSLDLAWTSSMIALPPLIGALTALENLVLFNCNNLVVLPEAISKLGKLTCLRLMGARSLPELPPSIGNLTTLKKLDLGSCWKLTKLPVTIGSLQSLTFLSVANCTQLTELPATIANLSAVQTLHVYGCTALLELPMEIGNLVSLKSLYLQSCSSLSALPESICELKSVDTLHLVYNQNIEVLPASIGELQGITSLRIKSCDTLTALPDTISQLTNLRDLAVSGCPKLQQIPDISNLTMLEDLSLEERLIDIEKIPEGFRQRNAIETDSQEGFIKWRSLQGRIFHPGVVLAAICIIVVVRLHRL